MKDFGGQYNGLDPGVNGVETDLHYTKDDIIFLMHDDKR
ncbi:glycerophosphodiester phosphodiesterase family protein [Paenibacillus cremeus]